MTPQPSAVHWAVVKVQGDVLDVVFASVAPSRHGAYLRAGGALADPPYTTEQIRARGYQARKVRITLESDQ